MRPVLECITVALQNNVNCSLAVCRGRRGARRLRLFFSSLVSGLWLWFRALCRRTLRSAQPLLFVVLSRFLLTECAFTLSRAAEVLLVLATLALLLLLVLLVVVVVVAVIDRRSRLLCAVDDDDRGRDPFITDINFSLFFSLLILFTEHCR